MLQVPHNTEQPSTHDVLRMLQDLGERVNSYMAAQEAANNAVAEMASRLQVLHTAQDDIRSQLSVIELPIPPGNTSRVRPTVSNTNHALSPSVLKVATLPVHTPRAQVMGSECKHTQSLPVLQLAPTSVNASDAQDTGSQTARTKKQHVPEHTTLYVNSSAAQLSVRAEPRSRQPTQGPSMSNMPRTTTRFPRPTAIRWR